MINFSKLNDENYITKKIEFYAKILKELDGDARIPACIELAYLNKELHQKIMKKKGV